MTVTLGATSMKVLEARQALKQDLVKSSSPDEQVFFFWIMAEVEKLQDTAERMAASLERLETLSATRGSR